MPGNCRSSKGETLTVRLLLNDFVANMVGLVLGRAPRILLTTAKTHRCCSLALSRTRNRLRDAGHRGILKRYRRLVVAVRRIRRLASIVAAHYSILLGRSGSTSATWTRSATCRSGNGLSSASGQPPQPTVELRPVGKTGGNPRQQPSDHPGELTVGHQAGDRLGDGERNQLLVSHITDRAWARNRQRTREYVGCNNEGLQRSVHRVLQSRVDRAGGPFLS
jgi:hypothetical protein